MSIDPARVDYRAHRGANFRTTVEWTDNDLNDYEALLQARSRDAEIAFSLGTLATGITVDEDGVATIALTPAQTRAIEPGRYDWDLLVEHKTTGEVDKLLFGSWTFYDTVTAHSPTEEAP